MNLCAEPGGESEGRLNPKRFRARALPIVPANASRGVGSAGAGSRILGGRAGRYATRSPRVHDEARAPVAKGSTLQAGR
jgi:hypothetical protein